MIVLVVNGVVVSKYSGDCAEIREKDLYVDGVKSAIGVSLLATTHVVPDQVLDLHSIDHTSKPIRWPDDVVQYTAEEKSKLPGAALAALKARGPATNESMPGLSERVGLIERYLGIEVE